MTVSPALAALLAWALLLSLFFNWYWSRKLVQTKHGLDNIVRVSSHNSLHAANHEAILITSILERANLPNKLPALDSKKFAALRDLYATYEFEGYDIPAQLTTDHDDRPAVYWKITELNELTAYEIARLWLARVI